MSTPVESSSRPVQIDEGMCFVYFAYDVGMQIHLDEAEAKITSQKGRKGIRQKQRTRKIFEFEPFPVSMVQEIQPLNVGNFQTTNNVELLLFDFGSVSVRYAIPIRGNFEELVQLSSHLYDDLTLSRHARETVQSLFETIRTAINKPALSEFSENYVIFQAQKTTPSLDVSALERAHGRDIARILRSEVMDLSEDEITSALSSRISYGSRDAAYIDWDSSFLYDSEAEDVRAVLEFANVALLEFRYLDRQLDQALPQAYEVLSRGTNWFRWLRKPGAFGRELKKVAQMQVDGAMLFEDVNNALKILGDQYLARVYNLAAGRFRFHSWNDSILRKLAAIESIYEKLHDEETNRRMEYLEWIIIVLITVSILLPFIPGMPSFH